MPAVPFRTCISATMQLQMKPLASHQSRKNISGNDAVESVSTTRLSVFMPGAGDILPFETDLSVQSHETLQLVKCG